MEWVFSLGNDASAVFARAPAAWAEGLSPAQAELLAYAPATDINGSALSALGRDDGRNSRRGAGLFLADPFLQVADVARQLSRLGIGMVANLPSVQLIDGEAGGALERTGHGRSSELGRMQAFKARGFEIIAVACDREMLAECLDLAPAALVVHPGFAAAHAGPRRKQLAAARAMLKRAGASATPLRFLYQPHGLPEGEIGPAAALADGLVRLHPCSL